MSINKKIDEAIYCLLEENNKGNFNTYEMQDRLCMLNQLVDAKAKLKRKPLDPVTVSAIVNIIGIVLVLKHEQLGVISSKAFSMIRKI